MVPELIQYHIRTTPAYLAHVRRTGHHTPLRSSAPKEHTVLHQGTLMTPNEEQRSKPMQPGCALILEYAIRMLLFIECCTVATLWYCAVQSSLDSVEMLQKIPKTKFPSEKHVNDINNDKASKNKSSLWFWLHLSTFWHKFEQRLAYFSRLLIMTRDLN